MVDTNSKDMGDTFSQRRCAHIRCHRERAETASFHRLIFEVASFENPSAGGMQSPLSHGKPRLNLGSKPVGYSADDNLCGQGQVEDKNVKFYRQSNA